MEREPLRSAALEPLRLRQEQPAQVRRSGRTCGARNDRGAGGTTAGASRGRRQQRPIRGGSCVCRPGTYGSTASMFGAEAAPLVAVEVQIAASRCLVSAECQNAVRAGAEAASGAPPGAMGSVPELDWGRLSGMLRRAARGKGNFGIGAATAEQVEVMGRAWVGEGATVASDGSTLLSADRLRQYRPPSYKPRLGRVQANLDGRSEASGAWQSNAHVDVTE